MMGSKSTACILLVILIFILVNVAEAATDYIAPGTPATVGRSGSLVGNTPGTAVPAPRGAMGTLGLPEGTPGDKRADQRPDKRVDKRAAGPGQDAPPASQNGDAAPPR